MHKRLVVVFYFFLSLNLLFLSYWFQVSLTNPMQKKFHFKREEKRKNEWSWWEYFLKYIFFIWIIRYQSPVALSIKTFLTSRPSWFGLKTVVVLIFPVARRRCERIFATPLECIPSRLASVLARWLLTHFEARKLS